MIPLSLVGAAYAQPDFSLDAQTCINLYPQAAESGGGVSALLPTPGLIRLFDLQDACRGLLVLEDGGLLAVMGQSLYLITTTAQKIGTVGGFGPVKMASNGLSVVLAGVGASLAYTISSKTLSAVSFAGQMASHVAVLAGRFVVNRVDTGQILWSGLYDTVFDALSYSTAESSPDKLVAIAENNDQLWLFGSKTAEIWYSTGDKDQPFLKMQGTSVQAGCVAPESVAKMGQSMVWLANSPAGTGQVVMTEGYQPKRISTHAMEQAIRSYPTIEDAHAFVYQQDGHGFYLLTFPSAGVTWCFDLATGLWHQRASWVDGIGFDCHRAKYHALVGQRHVVSDRINGLLYELTDAALVDDDRPIVRERTCPVVQADGGYVRHLALSITAQTGTAAVGDREPVLSLAWSDDHGRTWAAERLASLGKQGEYKRRIIWRRLGLSRNRLYRLRCADPVRLVLSGGLLEAES